MIAAASSDVGTLVAIGSIVVLLLGLVAVAPSIRRNQIRATVELQQTELTAERNARIAQEVRYKDEIAELKAENTAQEQRCNDRIADESRRNAEAIGELRGRLNAMTPAFAKSIADHLRELGLAVRDEGANGG